MNIGMSFGRTVFEFQKHLDNQDKEMEKEVQKIVNETAKVLHKNAKRFTPKRSGLLRRSWNKKGSGKGAQRKVIIRNDIDYGLAVEYGTKKQKPVRMLKRAVNIGDMYMKRKLKALRARTKRKF